MIVVCGEKCHCMLEAVNPSNADVILSSIAQGRKDFWRPFKPCHVGIHWIPLPEYSQMSTHLPGFRSFFCFFCLILYWPNKPPAA